MLDGPVLLNVGAHQLPGSYHILSVLCPSDGACRRRLIGRDHSVDHRRVRATEARLRDKYNCGTETTSTHPPRNVGLVHYGLDYSAEPGSPVFHTLLSLGVLDSPDGSQLSELILTVLVHSCL